MTQRDELLFWIWLKELNLFLFSNVTQRMNPFFSQNVSIEHLFHMSYFFTRLKELNLFLNVTQKNWFFFEYDSKNWTFFFFPWLKELNCSEKTQRLIFYKTQRIEPFFFEYDVFYNEINPFSLSMTQRIELFLNMIRKSWTIFFWIWLKELNLFFFEKNDSMNWTFFYHDSMNWTFFNMNSENWTCKKKRLRELNLIYMIQRIEYFLKDQRNSPFFEHDSKNWTFFPYDSKIFSIWLKELNLLFEHDSKNWTMF